MRIDEFARTADGTLDARDRLRFATVGFDILGLAVLPRPQGGGPAATWQQPPLPPVWPVTVTERGEAVLRLSAVGYGAFTAKETEVLRTAVGSAAAALVGDGAVALRSFATGRGKLTAAAYAALQLKAAGGGALSVQAQLIFRERATGSSWVVTAPAPVAIPRRIPYAIVPVDVHRRDEEEVLLLTEFLS